MEISQYTPNVKCEAPSHKPAEIYSCQMVLNRMPVTETDLFFGERGAALSDVPLPIHFFDRKSPPTYFISCFDVGSWND